jgi:hypothetical protein
MVIFRLIGLVLIVIALMLLGADVVSTLERGGETVMRSLGQILLLLGVDAKPWFEEQFPPQLANAFAIMLSWPGWAVLGLPGVLLGMAASGRRERRHRLPPAPPPPSSMNPQA